MLRSKEEVRAFLARHAIGWDSLDVAKRSIARLLERGPLSNEMCLALASDDIERQRLKAKHRASPSYPVVKLRDEDSKWSA